MQCICKPYPGFHLPACPCQKAYEHLKARELAESLPDEEARELGYRLAREGFHQTSRKYRSVRHRGRDLTLDPLTFAYFRKAASEQNEACITSWRGGKCDGRGRTRILDAAPLPPSCPKCGAYPQSEGCCERTWRIGL